MSVVPRGVHPRLLYTAGAIGLAIALFGIDGKRMREVRALVCPWPRVGDDATGWPSLRRWIARASSLWRSLRAVPPTFSRRLRAERIATTLAAHTSSHWPLSHAAFVGAALAP